MTAMIFIPPHCIAMELANPTITANQLNPPSAGNNTCNPNHIARFKTTPTTAAVILERAPVSFLLPLNFSIYGPPRKIKRKQGRKVK
jgi:hypothetical protein